MFNVFSHTRRIFRQSFRINQAIESILGCLEIHSNIFRVTRDSNILDDILCKNKYLENYCLEYIQHIWNLNVNTLILTAM